MFAALSFLKSLKYHSHLLARDEADAMQMRLKAACNWIGANIVPERRLNINYVCAGAAALAEAGEYFADHEYASLAKALADLAFDCISEKRLLYGEGTPVKRVTAHGVRPVDVAYNVEESLPCLFEYARTAGDGALINRVKDITAAQLGLMLPDGAWDNSFGTRNFKWTYWGGRTSDGSQALLNALGKQDSCFAEAALRNLELMQKATDGLLYGGMDYRAHGEMPCVHHAFCHAKTLAQALDEGICEFERIPLPSDRPPALEAYRELNVSRAAKGDWRMTVCGGDFEYMRGGCASGGVITLLWHARYGAVIASANTDYSLKEAHNQQLSRMKAEHKCVCARLEGEDASQMYAYDAAAEYTVCARRVTVRIRGNLADLSHNPKPNSAGYELKYTLCEDGLRAAAHAPDGSCRFVLPVVSAWEEVKRCGGNQVCFRRNGVLLKLWSATPILSVNKAFNLSPGFCCSEIVIAPDAENSFSFSLLEGLEN